jgi:hypothetical protein
MSRAIAYADLLFYPNLAIIVQGASPDIGVPENSSLQHQIFFGHPFGHGLCGDE